MLRRAAVELASFPLVDLPGRSRTGRLAEGRVGDDHWLALAFSLHLHAQQVSSGGQIAHRIALERVAALVVDQGFERNEIEFTVGRDQQVGGIADHCTKRFEPFRQERERVV